MLTSTGQAYVSEPPLDEFADTMENLFLATHLSLTDRSHTQKQTGARFKVNKVCHESGLAAELLQHVPDEFLVELLRVNGILQHGSTPAGWTKILFTMHDASQKDPRKTRHRFPPQCQHREWAVFWNEPPQWWNQTRSTGGPIVKGKNRILLKA